MKKPHSYPSTIMDNHSGKCLAGHVAYPNELEDTRVETDYNDFIRSPQTEI